MMAGVVDFCIMTRRRGRERERERRRDESMG